MNVDGIKKMLMELGVDPGEIEDTGRGWVNCPCPLAPFTHASGADSRPSFGVSISDTRHSVYYCFGCTPKPRVLPNLLHETWVASGAYPTEAAHVYMQHEIHEEDESVDVTDTMVQYTEQPQINPLPSSVLLLYPLLQEARSPEATHLRHFLKHIRGVDEWWAYRCRVRHDPLSKTLVFPMTDTQGRIYVLRERSRLEKRIWTVSPKLAGMPHLKFPKLKHVGAWFGMEYVDWSKPVILVEGELDALRLMTLGWYNVIASATSSVTDAQIKALVADSLLLGYDADKGGRYAHRRILDTLNGASNVHLLDWSQVNKADGHPCKDAGDLVDAESMWTVLRNPKTP